jgi:hypothetical protein
MAKNNTLTLVLYILTALALQTSLLWAEPSEMDLLMAEKKQEPQRQVTPPPPPPAQREGIDLSIDTKKSLSENLDENLPAKAEKAEEAPVVAEIEEEEENWLQHLLSRGSEEIVKKINTSEEEENSGEQKSKKKLQSRSNAANFDISGVKLRMTPAEVEAALTKQGYRRVAQSYEIPNFIKWRGEEICRINGIVGFERLKACMTQLATEKGYRFIEYERYTRTSTLESIDVNYTSTFADNLSLRVYYKSSLPMSTSKASNNVYINNLKIYEFWRRIAAKYGEPDNATEVKWGLGGKKPYLKAQTGTLELVDPILKDLDVSRMINEDSKLANAQYYNF